MPRSRNDRKPCVCPVDFDRVNRVALTRSHELIAALLPGGVLPPRHPASRRFAHPRFRRLVILDAEEGEQ